MPATLTLVHDADRKPAKPVAAYQPDYSIAYGNRYDKSLSTTQIAAKVRAEIKAAQKAGKLPKGKIGIRTSYFSGGSSISIRAVGFQVLNPERLALDIREPHVFHEYGPALYTPRAAAMVKSLESLLSAYNFDGSDSMVDYFHVNFYGHVSFDGDATRDEYEAARELYGAQ